MNRGYRNPDFEVTFMPSQKGLLGSIQRARQRIFSSQNQLSQSNKTYDQNNPNISNTQHLMAPSDKVKQTKRICQIGPPPKSQIRKQQKQIVVNAIKVLQDKIIQLESKNKYLVTQLLDKTNNLSIMQQTDRKNKTYEPNYDTDDKYWILMHQCESLRKQKQVLVEQLTKHKDHNQHKVQTQTKDMGKKLDFHRERQVQKQSINQPITQPINQPTRQQNFKQSYQLKLNELKLKQSYQQKLKQLQQKYQGTLSEVNVLKNVLQKQKCKNISMLKLHQQQILKSQQLSLQLQQKSQLLTQLKKSSHKKSMITSRNLSIPNQNHQKLKKQNIQLNNMNKNLIEENQKLRKLNQRLDKDIRQGENSFLQVKEAFFQVYKHLDLYHPDIITVSFKYLHQKVKKITKPNKDYQRNSINKNRFNNLMRLSQSKKSKSRLSAFRSKSGKKGLKMQDLNSSNKSISRQRTNSKGSSKSSKQFYKSPNPPLLKQAVLKQVSPAPNLNKIQQILIQIKSLSKQIKQIKQQHRNISVKINTQSFTKNDQQLRLRMDQLIQQYNQYNNRLLELRKEKDRLAMNTIEQGTRKHR